MEIAKGQTFNLWDTNGRRNDITNAIKIYLDILSTIEEEFPDEPWSNYPNSLQQFRFYKKAIDESPEIFQEHGKYDDFVNSIQGDEEAFSRKRLSLTNNQKENLDKNIEARARHYTSNLVRLGLSDSNRDISPAGNMFRKGEIIRDEIEKQLPLDDINLIILRQLLKLRVFTTKDENGNRSFYSPCLLAFYLLTNGNAVDKDNFRYKIQGISPYWKDQYDLEQIVNEEVNIHDFIKNETQIPDCFQLPNKINRQDFITHIRNRKSNSVTAIYYDYYNALYDFVEDPTENTYSALSTFFHNNDTTKLNKAFGYGQPIFKCGTAAAPYSFSQFLNENHASPLLTSEFNKVLYQQYSDSKLIDSAYEYSDTTIRLLNATGVFKFGKPLVELSFSEIWRAIFNHFPLKEKIFGTVSQTEYDAYESGITAYFCQGKSLCEILGFNEETANQIINEIGIILGCDDLEIKNRLEENNRHLLEQHIEAKYPLNKTIELLKMFSDRSNDHRIKSIVNDSATVPTIYEYMVAVAWYYISGKTISVYDSLNLTLNADFEPEIHAAGGGGDIEVNYDEYMVLLEATLMNPTAQKRGEWEPVLRHATNLKTEIHPKSLVTLFVADKLDYNTINIWRAVASVPLKASNSEKQTDHVIIMPFTNEELCNFLEQGVKDSSIISAIHSSYNEISTDFNDHWRQDIMNTITN